MRSRFLLFTVVLLGFGYMMNAQLNEYKYVIVPKKFDAYKEQNKHLTSTTIKHLFVQNGFTAVYDDNLPDDLAIDRCLGLLVNLEDNSNLFSTKVMLTLRNCQSIEIFKTSEGRSKIKEYKAAYSDAINKAFASIKALNYTYTPKKEVSMKEEPITISFKNDVKSLEEKPKKQKVVIQEATPENQSYENREPIQVDQPLKKGVTITEKDLTSVVLYAQPIANGFQLVDTTPKVRLKLMETSVENVFMASGNGAGNGLVFKKDDKWIYETSENGQKKSMPLNIKF